MDENLITILTHELATTNAERLFFDVRARLRLRTDPKRRLLIENLRAGLQAIATPVLWNPTRDMLTSKVVVMGSIHALHSALLQKQKGTVKILCAGPDLANAPADHQNLFKDPLIDKVMVRSPWQKKWWSSLDQMFNERAQVWTPGVLDYGPGKNDSGPYIVYSRGTDEKLFRHIMDTLWAHKCPIIVSHYGKFNPKEYLRVLRGARGVIYLNNSPLDDSLLAQAWMANVPALMWEPTSVAHEGREFPVDALGPRYTQEKCGLSFTGGDDFESKLVEFCQQYATYQPRTYALSYLTSAISARKFLDIVSSA